MIELIRISDVAAFGSTPEELSSLSRINFIFGSNGSGKTTISRIIANEEEYGSCSVLWKAGTKLQPMVYNSDFVDRNFVQLSEMKGVFTLGEEQAEVLSQIENKKGEIDTLRRKNIRLSEELNGNEDSNGMIKDMTIIESKFKDDCWEMKKKYDDSFGTAFIGYRNSADRFRDKVLIEDSSNKSTLLDLSELLKKAENVFSEESLPEDKVIEIDGNSLVKHESNAILSKRIIGKDDVDIAAMIKKLGNSDWVRAGLNYFELNNSVCPFCQRTTEESFTKSLTEYFDETFIKDTKGIQDLAFRYSADADLLQQSINQIIANPSRFLDLEKLKFQSDLLNTKIVINNQRITEKVKEPSQIVVLEPLESILEVFNTLISTVNLEINNYNQVIANISIEKDKLIGEVWCLVLSELKDILDSYKKKKHELQKAISNIQDKIHENDREIGTKSQQLRDLEMRMTTIQPTIDGINDLLLKFGFQNFKLDKSDAGNFYKLIRSNGANAKDTLSEGEKTFVCFLYFYYLLKGSESESGMITDRIVVFDDPISSLDSEVLFIVSSLIKKLFEEVRSEAGIIKQIFVLTHNVYFQKEVAFNPKRRTRGVNDESFWIIRKLENTQKLQKHTSNPIKTSYELLWSEIRNPSRSNLTIQNTLRRILENYFKILGGIDPDRICDMFEGRDKLICKSLFSWVHDGSHFAQDDLYVAIDDIQIENYLQVFREIFNRSGHEAHYNMMMGNDSN
ncbi:MULTISPECIES: AAA family ATPase [Leptospira]|uniref:AAA domain protein n=1 Tax=Leptospira licerasiae str. MMD4847 TaxID=1049971 RepID=A0ABN0HB01_9LEPT|nr:MULTISPECIES: AAA family ATPase [Leptospira]EIE01379.1 hypothetical protein LEP1GSC185_3468 [Leptospira licerasiae serovar Varillal str. VAR 010]EJZ42775.1 AAA domain protein [Leptospira licerasiae str. MMD4847]